MKTIKRALCLLLCFSLILCGGICAAAGNDDPLTWSFNHAGGVLKSRFAPNSIYTHDRRFKDGYDVYKVIDVSYHNDDINWQKVASDGVYGVMIRAGYRGYGDTGTLNEDVKFKDNIRGAMEAGLKVGVYFYSQAVNAFEAEKEASYTVNLLDGVKLDLPVAYDLEYAEGSDGYIGRLYDANLSRREATALCVAFCETVKLSGYTPMLYSNKFMLNDKLNADELAERYPLWLACYNDSASYDGDYLMWQYTNTGRVDGIRTNVDLSFLYLPKSEEVPTTPDEPVTPPTPPEGEHTDPDVPQQPGDKPYARIEDSTLFLSVGDIVRLTADLEIKDIKGFASVSKTEAVWESSNPGVVSVDSEGRLEALSAGYSDITATVTISGHDSTFTPVETKTSYVITVCVSKKAPENGESQTGSETEEPEIEEMGFLQLMVELFSAFINAVILIISIFRK